MSLVSYQSQVFGPVPSRRLGYSLGVDFMPFKTCTYDCVYCQLGKTTCKTVERKTYLPMDGLVDLVKRKLEEGPSPDYITLSGSGEPTLHKELGKLMDSLRESLDIPVALLTNGSLLYLSEVREEAIKADLLIPSLDAGTNPSFLAVNRPCKEIRFEDMIKGLIETAKERKGRLWLEVFLVKGVNDSDEELQAMAKIIEKICPDQTHINTAVRPPAESHVQPVDEEVLLRARDILGKNVKIIAGFQKSSRDRISGLDPDDILGLLKRRPCTGQDIALGLGVHVHEVLKELQQLLRQGLIQQTERENKRYFTLADPE